MIRVATIPLPRTHGRLQNIVFARNAQSSKQPNIFTVRLTQLVSWGVGGWGLTMPPGLAHVVPKKRMSLSSRYIMVDYDLVV